MSNLLPVSDTGGVSQARPGRDLLALFLSVLACAACPVCLGTATSILSSLGVGFLLNEEVHGPLVVVAVTVAWSSLAHSAWRKRRAGPLLLASAGATFALGGELLGDQPWLAYPGFALLVSASLWNWRQRRAASTAAAPRLSPS
jgi:hypothetical protein